MDDVRRWTIATVALILVAGLLLWARGHQHHHGTAIGSLPSYSHVVARMR